MVANKLKSLNKYKRLTMKISTIFLLMFFLYAYMSILISVFYHFYPDLSPAKVFDFGNFSVKSIPNYFTLCDDYKLWFEEFVKVASSGQIGFVISLPFIGLVVLLMSLIGLYFTSYSAFALWFFIRAHIAKLTDIKKMGLLNGKFMMLGHAFGKRLSLSNKFSVLCLADEDMGKTTCIAIPSILQSDNASILALDSKGLLAKFTSGYRSKFTDAYYLNCDEAEKLDDDKRYARWNPLSADDLPPKGGFRITYIKYIAKYIASYNRTKSDNLFWEKLCTSTMEAFLQFFVSKVEQAAANDYFLSKLIENGRLNISDKELLCSYYTTIDKEYSADAIQNVMKNRLTEENYLPVGSWAKVPTPWCGKELCLPMFADTYMAGYFADKFGKTEENDVSKSIVEEMLTEATFFGYEKSCIDGLRQILSLTRPQRSMILPQLAEQLFLFKDDTLRQRMGGSDFTLLNLLGFGKNFEQLKRKVTVYCVANTNSGSFLMGLLADLVMRKAKMIAKDGYKNKPLLIIADGVKSLPRFDFLASSIDSGILNELYFLLLTKNMKSFENHYSREEIETIVTKTHYKVILAENNKNLSKKLISLSLYGSKSVQIPKEKIGAYIKLKSGISDAHYYTRLSKLVLGLKKSKLIEKGISFILAEGFYNLPIIAKSTTYTSDLLCRKKSLIPCHRFLTPDQVDLRNLQSLNTPSFVEIAKEIGFDVNINIKELIDYVDEIGRAHV